MYSMGFFKTVLRFASLNLLVSVYGKPKCQTYQGKDVVCTAGNSDYVLGRGLVSDNNKTTGITLRACRITDVDYEAFKNDENLRYIDLAENKITRLKLGVLDENKQVTYLNLSHNLLTTFPLGLFDQKPNLEVLDLKGNKLNLLERGVFDALSKLTYLDLSNNSLLGRDIDPQLFLRCPEIRFMDFSRNDMTGAPENFLQSFLKIDFLNLDRCSLRNVPFFVTTPPLKTMKHLMLSSNQISTIDHSDTFKSLVNLEILNLAENIIQSLATDLFIPLKKLKMVVLRSNRLKTVPDKLFFNMKALGNIDMSDNLIDYVPVNAFRGSSVRNLNLSHNKFSYLEANFCLELKNSGVNLNKFYFNDNPWQCACLNDLLKDVKYFNIRYNSNKYNGAYAVCVTTKVFKCKRQMSDNALFIELFNKKG